MKHLYQYTYEAFIKDMFANGFDWLDIEYYWRHENEYEQMLRDMQENSRLSPEEEAYWNYISCI